MKRGMTKAYKVNWLPCFLLLRCWTVTSAAIQRFALTSEQGHRDLCDRTLHWLLKARLSYVSLHQGTVCGIGARARDEPEEKVGILDVDQQRTVLPQWTTEYHQTNTIGFYG